ncbi:hypothetical protein Fmac_012005 [Flemingia macrophylla]|uniref:Protein kinase domain-containing protein n=1 Tax=Flemingia macrophylla TaxID=520843 RepID=A0ABD1MP17_9FABA
MGRHPTSEGNKTILFRCSIEGLQDTLWAVSRRQFYKECDIYGTVDFIYGNAATVFFHVQGPRVGGEAHVKRRHREERRHELKKFVPFCTDRQTKEELACKSISKRKLRTAVDVEDVRHEVAIMSTLPDHPNVVRLRATYEDHLDVHLVMELCAGGDGHYNERAATHVARTIAEVVRMCHSNGVMHRDLKLENFLFSSKKENSPLKAIDFGFSVFFKPGLFLFLFVCDSV